MHALRHVHRLLVPGGTLVDIHPVTEEQVEAGAEPVGVIAEPDWLGSDLPKARQRCAGRSRRGCTRSKPRPNTTCCSISTVPTS